MRQLSHTQGGGVKNYQISNIPSPMLCKSLNNTDWLVTNHSSPTGQIMNQQQQKYSLYDGKDGIGRREEETSRGAISKWIFMNEPKL